MKKKKKKEKCSSSLLKYVFIRRGALLKRKRKWSKYWFLTPPHPTSFLQNTPNTKLKSTIKSINAPQHNAITINPLGAK